MLRIGTRGSKLALIQAYIFIKKLMQRYKDIEVRIEKIKTSGDIFKEVPLHEIGGKGAFVGEINALVLKGKLDCAVHSLKDLPISIPNKLKIAAVLKRKIPKDVIIPKPFEELRLNAIVGTSSIRRKAQALYRRSDLLIKPLRGNIETRIRKIAENDAIILSKMAIENLGLKVENYELDFVTSPGQGAIAVVAANKKIIEKLHFLDDKKTRIEVSAERYLAKCLGGGCFAPVGVRANFDGKKIKIEAEIYSIDGKMKIGIKRFVSIDEIQKIGNELKRWRKILER